MSEDDRYHLMHSQTKTTALEHITATNLHSRDIATYGKTLRV